MPMMLIFASLLYLGPNILSSSASTTGSETATHICVDFDSITNKTSVKWGVSSPTPVDVSNCELLYRLIYRLSEVHFNGLPTSHGLSLVSDISMSSTWLISVRCDTSRNNGQSKTPSSPELPFIPGNSSSRHVCTDSGLRSLVSDSDVPLVLCVWRPEAQKNYVIVRWQPTILMSSKMDCVLHYAVRGQVFKHTVGLPSDDMQFITLNEDNLSAWVTCMDQQGQSWNSSRAEYTHGASSVCSEHVASQSPLPPTPPYISDDNPTKIPTHSHILISNMAMGLSLAAGILIAGVILSAGFIRWLRWQQRRRRERLLRHGEPASDQSAMEEFQQMM
ncbi:uncharacterized protein [Diadema antillarum]|uniref:uncharacterized protein n=1 Tax=Diadema antillarum TaxID=105358 RepID=UPI003A846DFD